MPEPGLSAVDPVRLLKADRARARANEDPMANLCVLATVGDGVPEARTLVLRDVDERLGLFFNGHSPKAREVGRSDAVAVLVYLPSLSRQYRLRTTLTAIPADIVHANWQYRPDVPKQMDWLYERRPQSSPITSRRMLIEELPTAVPEVAPASAIGYYLAPLAIERLDLGQADGVHDRRRYTLHDEGWLEQILVP